MKDTNFTTEEFLNHGYQKDGSFILDEEWGVPNFSKDKNLKKMEKAINKNNNKKTIFVDLDGVLADFTTGYISAFNRDPHKDDSFTVGQFCRQEPHFFRDLPELEKGMELFDILKDDYEITIITTPMQGMLFCKRDKIEWVVEHLGNFDIIFSDNKADYVVDDQSILIDDMDYNIDPWNNAGGTAIKFPDKIDRICEKIENVFNPKDEPIIKKKLKEMAVNLNPTEKQKESGNYLKGDIETKGLKIKIENVPGSVRWGIGFHNDKWFNKMKDYYGYITGTIGNDNDPVDVFINPEGINRSLAFVVNQMSNGLFDEVKVMLGYDDEESATMAYLRNYSKGQEENIHSVVRTNTKKLRSWLEGGNYTEPFPTS